MTTFTSLQPLTTDALTGLRGLPDNTAQVALTSPPFYLLRRYGAATTWPDGWEGELGQEAHPNEFVRHLLDVFDEVWRVLKDDGCLWVNLADTFNNRQGKKGTTNAPNGSDGRFAAGGRRYAEALRQQEGNAMPEPTRDRPSRNYEFLFLFTKQPNYYFDRTAIDVPSRSSSHNGVLANAGSVWETRGEIVSDTEDEPDGLWRVNSEASPYRHVAMWPRALVRQMLLPTTRPGDTVIDPFAGSGTTGEVAHDLGLNAILIESSEPGKEALADRLQKLNGHLPVTA